MKIPVSHLPRSKRFKIERYFWRIQIPLAIAIRIVSPSLWTIVATTYIVILSLYALDLTANGAESAAEGAELTKEGNA